MCLELSVVVLMGKYIIQIFGCNVEGFCVHRCEWLNFCVDRQGYLGHWRQLC